MEKKFMANSKRILIATGIFPPQVGGPATYSKLLLEELPKKGFEVRVLSFGWFLKYPKIIRHFLYFLSLIWNGLKTDIIYAQDPVSVGLPSLWASKLLRKKFYLKIVGDYAWEQGAQRAGVKDLLDEFSIKKTGYPKFVQILKKIQLKVAKGADKIVVPSNYLKKIVSNWGIDSQKITVIYNAFNAPVINETKEDIRSEYGITGKVIISAGRLVPWKGFDTLILVTKELAEYISDIKLFIAGDGPDKSILEKIIKENHLDNRIVLLGKLDQKTLFKHIKASDLFVLNTSYEGLSHQLLEVMALGTPIVTTDVGGNPETITNNESGLLVPYNDKNRLKDSIQKLINEPEFSIKLVLNAKNKIQRFGEEKMLDEISAFLRA